MSLPSWERGLKFRFQLKCDEEQMSLPSWERGLKCHSVKVYPGTMSRSPRGSVD